MRIIEFDNQRHRVGPTPFDDSILTERQKECLSYIAMGLSSKEIAREMNISPRTVEKHLALLREKLNVNLRSQLVRLYNSQF